MNNYAATHKSFFLSIFTSFPATLKCLCVLFRPVPYSQRTIPTSYHPTQRLLWSHFITLLFHNNVWGNLNDICVFKEKVRELQAAFISDGNRSNKEILICIDKIACKFVLMCLYFIQSSWQFLNHGSLFQKSICISVVPIYLVSDPDTYLAIYKISTL